MPHARILRSAVRDLDEIWLYIARDSVDAAERLIAAIEAAAHTLSENPGMGRRRDELLAGVRSFPVGSYILFYRKTQRGIDVLHVYHGARYIEELFGDENR
ncbi:MAG: type II toxin-antitoxin system RelE/ParE family toxin [Tepidisphaeraceae bacterium]